MDSSLWIIAGLVLATFAVLVVGVVFMAIGGKLDRKYSNRLMVLRVTFQGLALLAIGVLLFLAQNH